MTKDDAKALARVAVSKIVSAQAMEAQKSQALLDTLVPEAETEALVINILDGRANPQITDEELRVLIHEVSVIRYSNTCIDLALKGLVTIDVDMNAPNPQDRLVFRRRKATAGPLGEALRSQP